ncbi:hypothetical protein BHL53_14600 [Bacillus cereus]|uniref:hypothetical protein n=1 Tax=Bacillus cereus TaxID=1396 RepID=UPI000995019E|nr:hypothetical protein [Bacillus cereus]OPA24189.1 hypothetical protein BHL53_14600 [Bacillus cereus]
MEGIDVSRLVEYKIFGVLFFWLFKNTVKRNDDREKLYIEKIEQNQEYIKNQTVALKGIKEIKKSL